MKTEMKLILAVASLFVVMAAGVVISSEPANAIDDPEGYEDWDSVDGQYSIETENGKEYYRQVSDDNQTTTVYLEAIYDSKTQAITELDTPVATVNGDQWNASSTLFPNLKTPYSTLFQATFKGTDYEYTTGDKDKDSDVELMGFSMDGYTYSNLTVTRIDNSKIVDSVKPDEFGRYIYVDAVTFSVTVTPNDDPSKVYTAASLKAPFVVSKLNIVDYITSTTDYVYDGYKHYLAYTLDKNVVLESVVVLDELKVMLPGSNEWVEVGQEYGVLAGKYQAYISLQDDPVYYASHDLLTWEIKPRDLGEYPVVVSIDTVAQGEKLTGSSIHIEVPGVNPAALKDSKYVPLDPFTKTVLKIRGNYAGYTFETKDITADGGTAVLNFVLNYTGTIECEYTMVPMPLEGELHVNLIYTDGTLNADMFTDANVFIYPYEQSYAMYDEDGNYIEADNKPLNISRNQYKIVVLDANGNVVVNEMNDPEKGPDMPGSGMTSSEWNHIELYGTNGFKGRIVGTFYVSFVYTNDSSFSSNGIEYTVTSADKMTVSVTGCDDNVADVVIPSFVNGFKVTKIADKAFSGKAVTSVVIGDKVTSIGMKAFANCTMLNSVVFGNSVKVISSYAFYGCKSLSEIEFNDKLTTIREAAFAGCALSKIDFGSNLAKVEDKAFKSITFQDASGKTLDATAKNLSGNTFEGSKKVLKLVV